MKPLRIFCAVEREPFKGSRLWYNNIIDALKDLGHEIVEFEYDIDPFYRHTDLELLANRDWVEQHRPKLQAELSRQIQIRHAEKPIDIFFSYFYDAHCRPKIIDAIKAMGIKTYNWYCNASYQLNLVANLAPAYDFCLVPEAFRMTNYRALGAHPIYCQEAANPKFYKKLDLAHDLGAVFIGQNYADRLNYCTALDDAGLPLQIWGHRWQIQPDSFIKSAAKRILGRDVRKNLPPSLVHEPCTDVEMVNIYNRAKIALGFGVVAADDFKSKPVFQIRLRDFEAPMCGAFYLTQHQDELDEFFKIGQEIETFRTREELVDKVRFYLEHDEARERIARAGHQRAVNEHSWQRRLTEVFEKTSAQASNAGGATESAAKS